MKRFFRLMLQYPVVRIIVVILVTAATLYFVYLHNWLWVTICFAGLCAGINWTVKLYNTQTRKVIYMLEALENSDSGLRFSETDGTWSSRVINELINRVSHILNEAKSETIQQEKYYELILSCINTGIIVLNDSGYVFQKNNEALRLLGLEVFTHVRQLERIDPVLMERITEARPGETSQLAFANERGNIHLSIRVSEINIRNEHLRILTLNDINSELDEKELDSWIRLIRVLTHEIMNSVTPITSLSDTLLSIADNNNEEVKNGLQTISATGKGLLSFVESYRKFTRIPTPEPTLFYVKAFTERMVELTRHQHNCSHISFHLDIKPSDLILHADENLISQVMINLLKNSVQAIGDADEGRIDIRAFSNEQDEVIIEVSNDGPRIDPEVAKQIFVPFFTTKEGGNGIGLSLSRQVMRVSGGSLTLMPYAGKNTIFRLRFK